MEPYMVSLGALQNSGFWLVKAKQMIAKLSGNYIGRSRLLLGGTCPLGML